MELEERQRPPLSRISTANCGNNQEICKIEEICKQQRPEVQTFSAVYG